MYDIQNEDQEHRARRISLYQSQHMNHGAISQLFEQEEKQALELKESKAQSERRAIEETEVQETLNCKKHEILEQISESVTELSKHEDSEILASYLKKKVFDPITNQTDECQILILANWKNGNITYLVQVNPNVIPLDQIETVKIVAKDGYKQPESKQKSYTQGTPEFDDIIKKMEKGEIK